MSKVITSLDLGNRHGETPASKLKMFSNRALIDKVEVCISDHDHYAFIVAQSTGMESDMGGIYYLDAEDMDELCRQWLAARGQ